MQITNECKMNYPCFQEFSLITFTFYVKLTNSTDELKEKKFNTCAYLLQITTITHNC